MVENPRTLVCRDGIHVMLKHDINCTIFRTKMDIDLSNTVEMDSRTDRIINSQTILKTPEKPPSPTYNYRQNHVTNVILAGTETSGKMFMKYITPLTPTFI